MKSINFIKPVPNNVRTSINRWFIISTIACVTLILGLTAITIHQIYNLYQTNVSTIASSTQEPIDIQAHETKLSKLENLHTKLTSKKTGHRTPALALKELQKHAQSVEITSISFLPHKQYKLEGTTQNIENVTAMLKNLNEATHIHESTITSIQPLNSDAGKGIQFTLQGCYRPNL